MEIFWGMAVFFLFVTVTFIGIAMAVPEWFGITGKKALEVQKHQAEDAAQSAPAVDPIASIATKDDVKPKERS